MPFKKAPSTGGMQPMSRALRPGVSEQTNPTSSKSPAFDLGSLKGPKTGPMTSTGKKPAATIGKGISSKGMKPPSFKGRPSPRGR